MTTITLSPQDKELRDRIALGVLQALLQSSSRWSLDKKPARTSAEYSKIAYSFADSMMSAREVAQ